MYAIRSYYVAFLDDDPAKIGRSIDGVPILGPIRQIARLVRIGPNDEALIAIPSASPETLREIYVITSYSIHYTKLYEFSSTRDLWYFVVMKYFALQVKTRSEELFIKRATQSFSRGASSPVTMLFPRRRMVIRKAGAAKTTLEPSYNFV